MYKYIVLLLSFLTVLPARANLGENVKELVARYGTPVNYAEPNPKFPFGKVVFQASGITLIVFLLGEKEVGARVSKTDKSAFSDLERQTIMASDGGTQWTPTAGPDSNTLQWTRPDHATLMYDKQENMLIFTSDQMAKAMQVIQDATSTSTNAPAAQAPVAPVPPTAPVTN